MSNDLVCEGFPEMTCPNDAPAVYDMLGYQLCERCADNWRQPHMGRMASKAIRDSENTRLRAEIAQLRAAGELAYAVLVDEMECTDEDYAPAPEVAAAFNALYDALGKAPAPERDDDGADVPY